MIINRPMGWIMQQLSNLTGGNFALAVLLFTVLINLIFIPLSIKTQKSNAKQARVRPKMDMLKKKYGDDKMKYNEAVQKLYQQEKVSMTGGCLPMLIRLPFMMGIYYAVTNPLSNMLALSSDVITKAKELVATLIDKANPTELDVLSNWNSISGQVPEIAAAGKLNFNLFGLDLTQTPKFSLNFGEFQLIWLIPVLSFATAMLTSIISMKMQKKNNPDAPNMAGMMLTMPLISLFIAFTVPGAVGFYWACSNLASGAVSTVMSYIYSPNKIIAAEQAKMAMKRKEHERARMQRSLESAETEAAAE